jgi:peptidoglycan/xylan/chitin deacetylase (PgdA/CDA1 family)
MGGLSRIYGKISKEFKYGVQDILQLPVQIKKPVVLVFHGIDTEGNRKINSRFISHKKLDDLLVFFKKQVKFISVSDLFKGNFDSSQPHMALSFDDGYRNNLQWLLPILEKHQIPASIYITTARTQGYDMLWTDCMDLAAYIDHTPFILDGDKFIHTGVKGYRSVQTHEYLKSLAKKKDWNYKHRLMETLPGAGGIRQNPRLKVYWELLNEEEIRTLSKSPLITIGSHAQLHNCLGESPHEEALEELKISKTYLENLIQKEVTELAYPDGSYTDPLALDAFEMGYSLQLIGNYLTEQSKTFSFLLPRFITNPHISPYNQLFCIAKGKYY